MKEVDNITNDVEIPFLKPEKLKNDLGSPTSKRSFQPNSLVVWSPDKYQGTKHVYTIIGVVFLSTLVILGVVTYLRRNNANCYCCWLLCFGGSVLTHQATGRHTVFTVDVSLSTPRSLCKRLCHSAIVVKADECVVRTLTLFFSIDCAWTLQTSSNVMWRDSDVFLGPCWLPICMYMFLFCLNNCLRKHRGMYKLFFLYI